MENGYSHKFIISENHYITISIKSNILAFNVWNFPDYNDSLYISKEVYDKLYDIIQNWNNKIISNMPKEDLKFIKSLKTSPEIQKIEDELHLCDPFSVKINGQTISFESSHLEGDYFGIKFQVGKYDPLDFEIPVVRDYHPEVHSYKSLSRKETLSCFLSYAKDARDGAFHSLQEFEENTYRGRLDYKKCKKAKDQLWNINNIEELIENLEDGQCDFTGWRVKDAEFKQSQDLKMG